MLSGSAGYVLLQIEMVQLCVSGSTAANLPHSINFESQVIITWTPERYPDQVALKGWLLGGSAKLPRASFSLPRVLAWRAQTVTVENDNNDCFVLLMLALCSRQLHRRRGTEAFLLPWIMLTSQNKNTHSRQVMAKCAFARRRHHPQTYLMQARPPHIVATYLDVVRFRLLKPCEPLLMAVRCSWTVFFDHVHVVDLHALFQDAHFRMRIFLYS